MIRRARMHGHADAVAARASTTRRSPPRSCSTGSSPGKGESRASLGRERYLERMWRFMDETRGVIARAASPAGRLGRLEPSAVHHGRGVAKARSGRRSSACTTTASPTGTRQLINWCPGCRTSLSDLEVVRKPQTGTLWSVRYHLVRDDGSLDPDEHDHRRHDAAGDDPGRHRRGCPSRRPALPGARRPAGPDPVRRAGRARHRGRGRRAGTSARARSRSRRRTTTTTSPPGSATACRSSTS